MKNFWLVDCGGRDWARFTAGHDARWYTPFRRQPRATTNSPGADIAHDSRHAGLVRICSDAIHRRRRRGRRYFTMPPIGRRWSAPPQASRLSKIGHFDSTLYGFAVESRSRGLSPPRPRKRYHRRFIDFSAYHTARRRAHTAPISARARAHDDRQCRSRLAPSMRVAMRQVFDIPIFDVRAQLKIGTYSSSGAAAPAATPRAAPIVPSPIAKDVSIIKLAAERTGYRAIFLAGYISLPLPPRAIIFLSAA